MVLLDTEGIVVTSAWLRNRIVFTIRHNLYLKLLSLTFPRIPGCMLLREIDQEKYLQMYLINFIVLKKLKYFCYHYVVFSS